MMMKMMGRWILVVTVLAGAGQVAAYAAAALIGTAIGWGDELVQAILPNRVYDLRDVALNAAGSVLGVVVLAACRAERVSDGSSSRRSPPPAGS